MCVIGSCFSKSLRATNKSMYVAILNRNEKEWQKSKKKKTEWALCIDITMLETPCGARETEQRREEILNGKGITVEKVFRKKFPISMSMARLSGLALLFSFVTSFQPIFCSSLFTIFSLAFALQVLLTKKKMVIITHLEILFLQK